MHPYIFLEKSSELGTSDLIGQKAFNLQLIPEQWHLPFMVITTHVYHDWKDGSDEKKETLLREVVEQALVHIRQWSELWTKGIILRSSATIETLQDRGAYKSEELTADYNNVTVCKGIADIYTHFIKVTEGTQNSIAILIQPLVPQKGLGQLSNERRLATSTNYWTVSSNQFSSEKARLTSVKGQLPSIDSPLPSTTLRIKKDTLRRLGRWAIDLKKGPCRIEWASDEKKLWVLQIDFEDDSPDNGVDPEVLQRTTELHPSISPPPDSLLKEVNLQGPELHWSKIDKAITFQQLRNQPFPKLFYILGSSLDQNLDEEVLLKDINTVTQGRAVCRTDCKSEIIQRENLPRTNSVSPQQAISFLKETLKSLKEQGVEAKEVCFIIHKFIPALASAWALAHPRGTTVKIDALWGIPDGLQYYPHDRYEVNLPKKIVATERIRYKFSYIQEQDDGEWNQAYISRKKARHTTLSKADLFEISDFTQALANHLNHVVQIMWFCRIPNELEIGRNLPWYSQKEEDYTTEAPTPRQPIPEFSIKTLEDIRKASNLLGDHCLVLEPEIHLVRDSDQFLHPIAALALQRGWNVYIKGSTISHAYYILKRQGVNVYEDDPPKYTKKRNVQVFRKLVRDDIPDKIRMKGESVVRARIDQSESRNALLVKLFEEAMELQAARTPSEVSEELADILEVTRAICIATGTNWKNIRDIADKKRQERGSFKDGVVLMETSIPPHNNESTPEPKVISLAALASITHQGNSIEVTFPYFMTGESNDPIKLPDGSFLYLSITKNGLLIKHEKHAKPKDINQLSLWNDKEFLP